MMPSRLLGLNQPRSCPLKELDGGQAGEHAHCGRGVLAGGFSYHPAAFAAAGVEVSVCGWRDMGVPTLLRMLEIVQARACMKPVELSVSCLIA